jgi:nicotinamidase-related amidase
MVKSHLLVIDPQVDFCDPSGSLYVPGAEDDMGRQGQ